MSSLQPQKRSQAVINESFGPRPNGQGAGSELLPKGYVLFYPTNRCNFRCRHCVIDSINVSKKELTLDEIKAVWGNSRVLQQVRTSLVGGEPFLRPDLSDMVSFMLDKGARVGITTNGSFPDRMRNLLEKIYHSIDRLNIILSIDGLEKTHDYIRQKGAFKKALETLDALKKFNCNFYVNTVLQPDNLAEIGAITDFFKSLGVHNGHPPLKAFPGSDRYYDIKKAYEKHMDGIMNYVYVPVEREYILKGGGLRIYDCHAGETSCYIDPEGNVFACLTSQENIRDDDFLMGSLRECDYDFDRLWASQQASDVRDRVKRCVGCFSGCEYSREIDLHQGGSFGPVMLEEKMTLLLNKGLCPTFSREDYLECARRFQESGDIEAAMECLSKVTPNAVPSSEILNLKQKIVELERCLSNRASEISELQNESRRLLEELSKIYNSRSWNAANKLNKFKGKVLGFFRIRIPQS